MGSEARPPVSVGVPVYNGEAYVEQALDAVLGQSVSDLEVVISDNASTDRTQEICRRRAAADPRVRYYRRSRNAGAAANYNRVFELSRGTYFKWAAADDLFSSDYVERCLAALESDPRAVLSYARTTIIGESGESLRSHDDDLDLRDPSPAKRFRQFLDVVGECNAVFGLIRADVLRRTPLIGNYVGSDIVLLSELSLYGAFHEIPERLFFRRDHPRASSSDKSVHSQQDFFDPEIRGRAEMTACRHHWQYLRAVRRAPLPVGVRWALWGHVLRHAWWNRERLGGELRGWLRARPAAERRVER